MGREMVKGLSILAMEKEKSMKANGKIMKKMVKGLRIVFQTKSMRVNGKTGREMEKELRIVPQTKSMTANGKIICGMVKGLSIMKMETKVMKANGKMA